MEARISSATVGSYPTNTGPLPQGTVTRNTRGFNSRAAAPELVPPSHDSHWSRPSRPGHDETGSGLVARHLRVRRDVLAAGEAAHRRVSGERGNSA
jgi:hypothetical protein